jgi:drug/metabolite transporter (DMT)-like permease
MIVPAVTFVAMNVLGFVALRNMSAAAFAVLQQLKILTTAVLSVRAWRGRRGRRGGAAWRE